MIEATEHVKLGHGHYSVVPQPLPLLKHELGPLLGKLADSDLEAGNIGDALTGGFHSLLRVFIPDLMPLHEWEGYATRESFDAEEFDAATARRLAPTTIEVKFAVKVCAKVNGIDLWNSLGSVLDPTVLSRWADDLRGIIVSQMRSRLESSTSSSSEGSGSPSTTSSTTVDLEESAIHSVPA